MEWMAGRKFGISLAAKILIIFLFCLGFLFGMCV